MTYQSKIRYRYSNKNVHVWMYAKIFLPLIFLNILAIAFYTSTVLSIIIVILSIIFFAIIVKLISRRHKVPFVEIVNDTLNYFDPEKGEVVSVPAKDITHISTRFCELNVHTHENIHSLNLGLIRNAKTRWEIKEMIRKMAHGNI